MSCSISIWKDKILLSWDGTMPPGYGPHDHVEIQDMPKIWKHLKGHCSYNKKLKKFVLFFSKQNLVRLRSQFGSIPIVHGYGRVTELKGSCDSLMAMRDFGERVKQGEFCDINIEYKLPPLAEYQKRGTAFLYHLYKAPLFADCGCLSGDTMIKYNRAGISRTRTIRDLYKTFNGSRINQSIPTKVRSFNGERIQLHTIRRVVESGVKPVLRLTLEDGKEIKLTYDHEVLSRRGWVPSGKLCTDDFIMVDNLIRHQKKKVKKEKGKKRSDLRLAVGKYHKFARKQFSHEGKSHSYLVEKHRAIFDAHSNGLTLKEFVACTRDKNKSESLFFVDTSKYDIHHLNGDHYDNDPENLSMLTKTAHAQFHTKGYKNFCHGTPEYSKVKSIKVLGEEMTYDIVCDDPHRNFVANGIVVHNCGKTYMVLVSTEQQIKTRRLQRGKTLVCGKLATLETGWAADTKKFTDLKANVLWAPPGKKRKEKILEKLNEEADLYIINHEGVKVFMEELAAKRFEKVVVDESTILKSFTGLHSRISGGVLGKAIMAVAEHAVYRVIMSGTPAPNGPEDLWGQFHFLDPDGILLEAGFKDFRQHYMERIVFGRLKKDKDGNDIPGEPENRNTPSKWVMTKGAEKIIHSIIDPHVFRVRIRDHLKDLPPKTVVKRAIQMKPSQQKIYDDVQKELWVFLKDGKVSTENALTELIKLRQVTGGFLIADDGEPRPLDDNPKVEMMDQLLNDEIDSEHKVVIFAQYRWEIEMLQNRYKDHGVVTVYGGNTGNNNLKNLNTFMEDPKCRIIILHPRSAAHGITLTMAHYMIFYSVSYSSEENYQSVARIERASQKNPMFVYYLLAKAKKGFSIDEIIYKVLISKQRKQELLLDLKQGDIDSDILKTWKNQFG